MSNTQQYYLSPSPFVVKKKEEKERKIETPLVLGYPNSISQKRTKVGKEKDEREGSNVKRDNLKIVPPILTTDM